MQKYCKLFNPPVGKTISQLYGGAKSFVSLCYIFGGTKSQYIMGLESNGT